MNEIKDGILYFTDRAMAYKLNATPLKGKYKVIATEYTTKRLGEIDYFERMKAFRKEFEKLKNEIFDPNVIYDARLRPYQNIDVEALSKIKQKGVFNAMRCGKTPTTIQSVVNEGYNKVLVIVPSFLQYQWQDEFIKWSNFTEQDIFIANCTPNKRLEIYRKVAKLDKAVLIISYDTVKADIKKYIHLGEGFDAMILDEAHFLRNTKSNRSQAVIELGKVIPVKYALTGTPAVQHPKDIYGILKFLYPKRFTSQYQFCDQFFEKVYDPFAYGNFVYDGFKPNMEKDLQNYLSCMSIQRKAEDVMNWLPEITRQKIRLDMSSKQQKLYDKMFDEFVIEIAGKEINAQNALVQAMRLQQLSICPEIFGEGVPSSKVDFVIDFIESNPLEPIIVFSSFTSALKVLHSKIKDSVLLTGEQSAEQKKANVEAFQSRKTNVILANIQAGSVGWTMDRANTMIFLNRSFIPVDNQQAEARFLNTRPDMPNKNKTIIDLVNNRSRDMDLLDVYEGKLTLIDVINSYGKEEW